MDKDTKATEEPMEIDSTNGSETHGSGLDNWEKIDNPVTPEAPEQLINIQPTLTENDIVMAASNLANELNKFVENMSTENILKFNHAFKEKAVHLFQNSNPSSPPNKSPSVRREYCSIGMQTTLSDAVASSNLTADKDLASSIRTKIDRLEESQNGGRSHLSNLQQTNQTKLSGVKNESTHFPASIQQQIDTANKCDHSCSKRIESNSATTIISTVTNNTQPCDQPSETHDKIPDKPKASSYSRRSVSLGRSLYSEALKGYKKEQSFNEPELRPIPKKRSFFDAPVQTQVANVNKNNNDWIQNNSSNSEHRQQHFLKSNKKSLNILVLGQTGVGKSTWINAFANYLIYQTMEEAITAEAPICVIPTKFSLFDNNYQRREIIFGAHDNEIFSDQGQSATQNARTYLLEHSEYDIYIIDTPGIGDTRGPEQDNANLKKILRAVAPFKEIHAICFLFKANDARLTPSFRYCIGRLLANLSKSALNNACFVFTNARGTFYKPGDTMGPLKAYFKELREKEDLTVPIDDGNTFCLDNEAFRFICAYFSGIQFSDEEHESFSDSWKHSSQEINRFIDHAARTRPHNTSDTLSVNEARTCILQLVEPIIEISNIIQTNIERQQDRIKELKSIENNIEELQKRTAIPITTIKINQLRHPRTICTSPKCMEYKDVSGSYQPFYTTICHPNCHLLNVNPDRVPDPALRECEAFSGKNNTCKRCGCSWKVHMRITYEKLIVTDFVANESLKNALANNEDVSKVKKQMIRNSRKLIENYDGEFSFILNAMAKFSIFLAKNGISQDSDIFEKQMENLIENEEKILRAIPQYDDKKYNRLVDLIQFYQEKRRKVLDANMDMPLEEIQDIQQKLFTLPLTGSKIAEIFGMHVEADQHDYATNITHCDEMSLKKKSIEWFKKAATTALNFAKNILN